MSWDHPIVLSLVPLALVATWWLFRRRRAAAAPPLDSIRRLWADRHGLRDVPAATRRRARGALLALATVCALLALARPQWGTVEEKTYDQSREVLLALDLSRSMLADDVSPTRLTRAKLLIESLLDQLRGERVGLLLFAGTSFLQSPLSADYEVLRDFLPELVPSYLPQGGTDYGAMLRTAIKAFGQTGDGDRFLVVLSDGESHGEQWKEMLPALRRRGIRVVGLGIGTLQGALLPDGRGGLVKDEEGAAVLSRLQPATLQELAEKTGGAYRDAATWVDVAALVDATVEEGMKGRYVEQREVRLQDQYQWFLAPALLLLLLSYWLEFPVYPVARRLPLKTRQGHPAAARAAGALLIVLGVWALPRPAGAAAAEGANELETTVAELVAQPILIADDYERLAAETVGYASGADAKANEARIGVIDDALAAVDVGEQLDPAAADWPALREQLERLKEAMQERPQQNQDQQSQDEQNQDEQGQDQQNQGQQQSQDGGEQNQQPSQESGGQQQAGDDPSQQSSGESGDSAEQEQQGQNSSGEGSGDGASEDSQHGSAPAGESEQEEDRQQAEAGGRDDERDESNSEDAPSAGRLADQEHAGQDEPGEPAPLDADEAGFGELEAQHLAEQPDAEPEQSEPQQRLVGGGRALQGVPPDGNMELFEAAAAMERIREGDSPSVLFARMNQAENQRQPADAGKNW